MNRIALSWAGAIAVCLGALMFATLDQGGEQTPAERVYELSQSFSCPVCNGQSVAESDVVVARTIRAEIRRLVDDGASDEQIESELVAAYTQDISYNPPNSGFSALVWVMPVVVTVAAFVILAMTFRYWSAVGDLVASREDQALVDAEREQR